MHRALPFILCCLCLTGCVSHTRTADQATFAPFPPPSTALPPTRQLPVLQPLFHEDEEAFRELVKAGLLGLFGQPLPERVLRRWEPLDIYGDRANLVLVLRRDAHEERGLYVVTTFSSFLPPSHDGEWSWEPIRFSEPHGIYSDGVYQYRRTR